MNYWVISDTHFAHDKLVKSGYRQDGFEDKIIKNCVNHIKEKDVLIHLGDVALYKDAYYHDLFLLSIKSSKNILVLGNHDRRTLSWYYDRGWSFVCTSFDLNIFGFNFRFTHIPIDASEKMGSSIDFNIHGHLHDRSHRDYEMEDFHYLVSIEETMTPVSLRKISENIKGV